MNIKDLGNFLDNLQYSNNIIRNKILRNILINSCTLQSILIQLDRIYENTEHFSVISKMAAGIKICIILNHPLFSLDRWEIFLSSEYF